MSKAITQLQNAVDAKETDDLVDRIAKEVAALVSDHIETMYPAAAKAVAWKSCKRSIQGVVRNAVAAAGRAAENGNADAWIFASAERRRKLRALAQVQG